MHTFLYRLVMCIPLKLMNRGLNGMQRLGIAPCESTPLREGPRFVLDVLPLSGEYFLSHPAFPRLTFFLASPIQPNGACELRTPSAYIRPGIATATDQQISLSLFVPFFHCQVVSDECGRYFSLCFHVCRVWELSLFPR